MASPSHLGTIKPTVYCPVQSLRPRVPPRPLPPLLVQASPSFPPPHLPHKLSGKTLSYSLPPLRKLRSWLVLTMNHQRRKENVSRRSSQLNFTILFISS